MMMMLLWMWVGLGTDMTHRRSGSPRPDQALRAAATRHPFPLFGQECPGISPKGTVSAGADAKPTNAQRLHGTAPAQLNGQGTVGP